MTKEVTLGISPAPRHAKPTGRCYRCKRNKATKTWGDVMTIVHGGGLGVCERCVVEVQLKHAKERAVLISELEERLAALGGPATTVVNELY